MAVKLDMSKAYDRVESVFLQEALLAFGFDTRWVSMVMKVVTSVSYCYKVNRCLTEKIIPQRGLRQGTLSPLSFSPYC